MAIQLLDFVVVEMQHVDVSEAVLLEVVKVALPVLFLV